jgi:hypothetical protein
MGREDHLRRTDRVFDTAFGGLRQKVDQAKLTLRVQMRLRFFYQQERKTLWLSAEKQQFAGHEQEIVRAQTEAAARSSGRRFEQTELKSLQDLPQPSPVVPPSFKSIFPLTRSPDSDSDDRY